MIRDDPILIVGAARSGTSMVAGCVEICGAFGGNMRGEMPAAPKGMFENHAIIKEVIKPLLKKVGADPLGQRPLPDIETVQAMANADGEWLRDAVVKIMEREGIIGLQSWFFKCPKSVHIWPMWHVAFPKARWLIVRRGDEGIINSCLRTTFMRAHGKSRAGWQTWIDQHKARFMEIVGREDIQSRQIWAKDIVQARFHVLAEVIDWLGLNMRPAAIAQFVEPIIYHSEDEDVTREVLRNGVQARARAHYG